MPLWLEVGSQAGMLAESLIPQDVWTHVAATWDGSGNACGTAILYINGREAARSCLGGGPMRGIPAGSLLMNELPPAGTQPRTGANLDDVAVWRQALTPDQVAALYTLGNEFGYAAAQADTLFSTPPELPCGGGRTQVEPRRPTSPRGEGQTADSRDPRWSNRDSLWRLDCGQVRSLALSLCRQDR